MIGFAVRKLYDLMTLFSSSDKFNCLIGLFSSKAFLHLSNISNSNKSSLSFVVLAFFPALSILLFIISKSDIASSRFTVSISRIGSISPSTCIILPSSKHLTTSTIASTSLICDKNLLPNPSPFEAPFTRPAISVNS